MAERAVVYLRVSSAGQDVAMQRRECAEYAESHGYDVVEVVEETKTGHDSYEWRPGLKRVRELLNAGGIDVLLGWESFRINRGSTDNMLLLQLTGRTHTRLEAVHGGVTTNDMAGRMKAFMEGEAAELEWERIRLRTSSGRLERVVVDGMPLVGKHPLYGYRYTYVPGKHAGTVRKAGYELEPETAAVVRMCFEKVAAGTSLARLALELNAQHVPTSYQWLAAHGQVKEGGKVGETVWRRQALRRMLVNESYVGRHASYRTQRVQVGEYDGGEPKYQPKRRVEGDSQIVAMSIPPIVSEELFAQVQVTLAANKLESARRNRHPEATLLRLYAVCGHCGARMHTYRRKDGSRGFAYRCPNNHVDDDAKRCPAGHFAVNASVVDNAAWEQVAAIARDTDKLQRLIESRQNKTQAAIADMERESANLAAELEASQAEVATIKSRLGTATDVVYAALAERLRVVTSHVATLEKRQAATTTQVGKYSGTLVSLRELMTRLETPETAIEGIAEALGISPDVTVPLAALQAATPADIEAMRKTLGVPRPDPLATATYAEKRDILRLFGVRVLMYRQDSAEAKRLGKRWELTFSADSEPFNGLKAQAASPSTTRRSGRRARRS